MDEGERQIDEVFRVTQVGDTLRMMVDKVALRAEVRDRVSPVMQPVVDPADTPKLEGFVKDAGGEWDLDSITGAKGATVVEVVVRRIASNI